MTIDEYIEIQRQDVRSADLRVLRTFTDRMLDKLKEANASEYAGLTDAIHVVVQLLESPEVELAKDPLPLWLAEIGFAAGYLLRRFDLIPDHVAEIGFADDAIILQRVMERNQTDLCRSLAGDNGLNAGDS
ncbi:MAG TPA: YkvA family protein [Chthoniobacterales bacterium]|nr:YkvA family protein [Chthoniobacterales bacterium]